VYHKKKGVVKGPLGVIHWIFQGSFRISTKEALGKGPGERFTEDGWLFGFWSDPERGAVVKIEGHVKLG